MTDSAVLTYLDTGVLIAAAQGDVVLSDLAMTILTDGRHRFAASEMVWLETVPTARYLRLSPVIAFYETFFARVSAWTNIDGDLVQMAKEIAPRYGLGGADAIHAAAAIRLGAQVFVTTEKTTKPFFRMREFTVRRLV